MYLKPKRTKFAKAHKGRLSLVPKVHSNLAFGSFALLALQPARLSAAQLYAAELAIKRLLKRDGQLWSRVFPAIPVSKKPQQVRMGKGKGAIDHWVARLRSGSFIFELELSNPILAQRALKVAASKLPFKTKIISRI